ncbi:uncharacterized protein LOC119678047 [Teleopsis dalmanni]|uniref:uncharacterized protein LOC119678047 n=1 Tax=Teleopsis dalmanni TaxID=139649 RepID=UPI0018CE685A|nr:uncharacterized protein LOC119678047 [Teleopsis dalmanni]
MSYDDCNVLTTIYKNKQSEVTEEFFKNKQLPTNELSQICKPKKKFTRYNFMKEFLSTVLTTQDGENSSCVENLINEDITYNDLSLLCDEDLKLIGIENKTEREQLLNCFNQLPNQQESFDYVVNHADAKDYNKRILFYACNHMNAMRYAAAANGSKLNFVETDDETFNGKLYFSRLTDEAIEIIMKETKEVEKHIKYLNQVLNGKVNNKEEIFGSKIESKTSKLFIFGTLIISSVLLGIYYFK